MALLARISGGIALGLVLASVGGCYDGSPEMAGDSTTGGETTDASASDPTTSASGGSTGSGPTDCIAGQQDCACLDGSCVGVLQCVENVCRVPPNIDQPQDGQALAGMRYPLEVEVTADSFMWEQIDGPTATLDGVDQTLLLVDIPADAQPGDTLTFRLTATQNTIEDSRDVSITVMEAVFQDALPEVADPEQLGSAEGLAVAMQRLWVSSSEGFVSTFTDEGLFDQRYDAGMQPAGLWPGSYPMGDDNVDAMYFADPAAQAIRAMFQVTGEVQIVTDQTENGDPLGAVDDVVPLGNNGDLVFTSPGTGGVYIYLWEEGVTRLLTDAIGPQPDALTFGPEAAVVYVGTMGKVWRLPIDQQDNTAGEPQLYLDLGDEADPLNRVTGLAFDEAANLWVAMPDQVTLNLSRYIAGEPSEVHNQWIPPGVPSSFNDLRLTSGNDNTGLLYFTDAVSGRVGVVATGLGGL